MPIPHEVGRGTCAQGEACGVVNVVVRRHLLRQGICHELIAVVDLPEGSRKGGGVAAAVGALGRIARRSETAVASCSAGGGIVWRRVLAGATWRAAYIFGERMQRPLERGDVLSAVRAREEDDGVGGVRDVEDPPGGVFDQWLAHYARQ